MTLTERNITAFNEDAYRRIERLLQNRYNYERYVELRQAVIDAIPEDAEILLDVGCNVGTFEEMLSNAPRFAGSSLRVIGVDIATRCIAIASERKTLSSIFLPIGAEGLPLADSIFDAALMIEVIEHVEDKRSALAEVYRVLKPGGQLILTTPNADSVVLKMKRRLSPWIYRLFGRQAADVDEHVNGWKLRQLLDEAGFQVLSEHIYRYPQLYGMSYKGKKYGLIPPLPPSLYLKSAPILQSLTERLHLPEGILQRVCFTLFIVAAKDTGNR
jgi:ubiquinone/menaquinone biosynthesis C-methylase UbiE